MKTELPKQVFRFLFFSSLLCCILLGLLFIALSLCVPQVEIQRFHDAYLQRMWLFTKPFYPAWFALPQWILLLWIVCNLTLWIVNKCLKHHQHSLRLPLLSVPFLVLSVFVITVYSARNSDYLKQLYAPRESCVRGTTVLKTMRQKQSKIDEDDKIIVRYEKMAAAQPIRSKTQGRLWKVPEVILRRFTALSYKYTGGKYKDTEIKYRLRIPQKTEAGRKYPLLIWLHGAGESGDDNISQLSHMESLIPFIEGPMQRDFFILATQCPRDNKIWDRSSVKEGKSDAPMTFTMEILNDVMQKYPVDEQAISVFGFSSGGYGVWSMGKAYPGRFAALIPVSCNPHRNVSDFIIGYDTVVWTFNNAGDSGVVHSRVKEEIEQVHNKGGTAYMTTFDAKGHEAWRNAILETPLIDWLLWIRRNPPPLRVPYTVVPPERSKNDFFMIFIFPFYVGGTLLIFIPIIVLGMEKIIELEKREMYLETGEYESETDDEKED